MVQTGLDRLLADPAALAGRRYALLTQGAAVSADLEPAHLALARQGRPPSLLLGPEHGLFGVEQDMVPSADQADPWTGVPIVSLYGDSRASLRPDPAVFTGVDLLVVDVCDIGNRIYTYAATGIWAAEAALAAGGEVWFLDRPNPLGGVVVEGNRLRPGFRSFIGAFELPMRHGLTMGELAGLVLARGGISDGFRVWTMDGWRRYMSWTDTGRPWIAPSPNMPTADTALVFPGGCLVEATEASEGRGTTRPFELVGAPWIEPRALAARLAGAGLPGCRFAPTYFKPTFQKHAGEVCGGVHWVVDDPAVVPVYRAGVEIVAALYELGGDSFAWRREPYEFEGERPAIDLLCGDDAFRRALEGEGSVEHWLATWRDDEDAFRQERRGFLLYPEDA